jgi:hypothetical protein
MKVGHIVHRELQVQAQEHILLHQPEVLQEVVIPEVRPVAIQEVVLPAHLVILQAAVPVHQEAALPVHPQDPEVEVIEDNLNPYVRDLSREILKEPFPKLSLMKKVLITIISIFMAVIAIQAQNIQPLNMSMFSQNYPWGTARAMGMGGAFGALGADQTSLSINPAGIGVYRSSDFSFTLSVNNNYSSSNYLNHTGTDFSNKLKIGNIGYVYNHTWDKDKGLVGVSFGIAYNRLNDFNKNIVIKNPSSSSSLLDEFDYYANNQGGGALSSGQLNQYYEGLAWDTYLLDTALYGPGWYHSDFSNTHSYGQQMIRNIQTRGGIGEYDFSFGLNVSNKLYFGATIGIQNLDYEETVTHTETDVKGDIPNLNSFTFTQYLKVYGTGYNFKTGVIFKPIDLLRLGLAVHSPTFYKLSSDFNTTMYADFDKSFISDPPFESAPVVTDNNTFMTPWKFVGSLGLKFKQFGLLSMDVENLDYTNMQLTGDESVYQNDSVKAGYKSVTNLRFGAEGKIGRLALRAGLGLYPSAVKGSTSIDTKTYSAGIGYTGRSFYCDVAYVLLRNKSSHTLYQYIESEGSNGLPTWSYAPQVADIKNYVNRFVATIGFRF